MSGEQEAVKRTSSLTVYYFTAYRSPLTVAAMRALLSLIALVVSIAGCGYKGPLYLPKPKPEAQKPAPPLSAPDDKKSGNPE
jgi:predicted small lipoprotein YifL